MRAMELADRSTGWVRAGLAAVVVLLSLPGVAFGEEDATALFDGESLEGWKVVPEDQASHWRVEDGVITAGDGETKIPKNSFLCTDGEYGDFEFRCEFKLDGDPATGFINSGIQFRSSVTDDGHVSGYQADIGDPEWWGCIYDEHRRNKVVAKSDMAKIGDAVKRGDWNEYVIRCQGDRVQLFINGVETVDYTEPEPAATIPRTGIIAPQLHSGGAAQVWFRNLTVKPLPASDG